MQSVQDIVLRNVITNDEYMRKVIPFIRAEYFEGVANKVFVALVKYVDKYNGLPSKQALAMYIAENMQLTVDQQQNVGSLIDYVYTQEQEDIQWLLDTTEKWCQDRAIFNAVMESITIIDGKHDSLSKNALPKLLQDALAVSFDSHVGHDYIDDVDARYDFYHEQEYRIPFDIELLNQITKGGLPNKTLSIVLAPPGAGKSLFMCHQAANCLSQGRNVLYITMEMAEERIAERIDANLLDCPLDQLENLSREMLHDKVNSIRHGNGKLIIKEYPTGQAHTGHFRALLNELHLKRNFKPEIIFIDYLNICASSRLRSVGGSVNMYSYVKAIAEEIRGLAVEFNLPIVSATQTTRQGSTSTDPELQDTSESFGLPATCDLMLACISNDELSSLGQIMIKQLKNRFNDPNKHKRFVVGVDRSKMRLYDVDPTEQDDIVDDSPVFDQTKFGTADKYNNLVMEP